MTVVRAAWKLALVAVLSVSAMGLSSCAPPPQLRVTTVVSGLGLPWDVTFAPDGRMFFTERAGRFRVRHPGGTVRQLQADLSDLWAVGEVGLMGILVDPAFNQNRRLYTCQGHESGDAHDIRIVPWVVSSDGQRLVRRPAIVTGIPATSGSHGGCRLRFGGPDQSLWIGTGDATTGTNPQDLTSLGGKILRVNRFTGAGVAANPFSSSANANTRRVLSYGHRNVQGIARRADGTMWTVEHGTGRDDEINRGIRGNFGWDPVPGYNEGRPMTDLEKFPNAVVAAWSSGVPTLATSGATWLTGSQWGTWEDHLAVATLKDESLRIFRASPNGTKLTLVATLFKGRFGRLRAAQMGPDGALYLTTSNGNPQDRILRVAPA